MKPHQTTTSRRIRRKAMAWILAQRLPRRPKCTVTLYLSLLEHTPQVVNEQFMQVVGVCNNQL